MNGSCVAIQDAYPEPVDVGWVKALFAVGYSLVMGLGLAGNALTLYAVVSLKVTNNMLRKL